MERVKRGKTIKAHYTGKLDDGAVFDTSVNREPLEFTVGTNQVISGFEEAALGMLPGESKTVVIPAQNAYGTHREDLVLAIDKNNFPDDLKPKPNQRIRLRNADGSEYAVRVTDVSESTVTIDANHPLAGKDLTFEIKLVEIC
jgi:FKBP-type peptidyl-prolyl cis-trans isomerase 2